MQMHVLIFGDKWAAHDVFVKSTSIVKSWRRLLLALGKLDEEFVALAWMTRVLSQSNGGYFFLFFLSVLFSSMALWLLWVLWLLWLLWVGLLWLYHSLLIYLSNLP